MPDRRRWLTLRAVAECFEVEVRWIEEVYDLGLIEPIPPRAPELPEPEIPTESLERIARIVRLHRQGVNLAGIAILLSD